MEELKSHHGFNKCSFILRSVAPKLRPFNRKQVYTQISSRGDLMGIGVMKEGRIFLYKEIRKAGPKKKDMVGFSFNNHLDACFCQPVPSNACKSTHI